MQQILERPETVSPTTHVLLHLPLCLEPNHACLTHGLDNQVDSHAHVVPSQLCVSDQLTLQHNSLPETTMIIVMTPYSDLKAPDVFLTATLEALLCKRSMRGLPIFTRRGTSPSRNTTCSILCGIYEPGAVMCSA